MKKIIAFGLVGVLLAGGGITFYSLNKKSERANFELNILSIGDSITAGMVDEKGTWATNHNYHLSMILSEKGYRPRFIGSHIQPLSLGAEPLSDEGYGSYCIAENWESCNYSSQAEKLENNTLLGNLNNILIQSHIPQIIILQGGINDIHINQENAGVMGDPAISMLEMVKRVREKYNDALIVVIPVFEYGQASILPAVDKFNLDVAQGVKNMKSTIMIELPNYSVKENFFLDGVHPNSEGYRVMAEKIYEGIAKQKLLP
jgi:lysophospholipase L1-like esterase